ncbi:4-galactosyl-N-acetylglucosaminide 3-alpha-L-fucosyltransferase 9-like [Lytechinus variegatus]|uniref:4-galactosyl-N-acetylglucosaminide 3-alpha-L-fucosyltransferase 9-like n=1 Tax=Lytechinus variegatus TaxID=7654 RepID=UPI001BB290FC|nr:4-galactosyl-N-acetylglucosaminide 3-alpha-L-fucosyltransferase 9-like [Lytechinus variegatus]XP_041479717.1 4-galactosyl-N-acetylglucosaminide 3-alpha-L-fucosyltransferase 9-like [Lytechinus variegatus]XP_041479718.1 4-galactosyl-N-acetylglucosaminide 3-alpha-L-fucosyltransferase 9-like [Lytechinus variegatus]XP_041479719.1 4-galactosyl-N-acetylglucosaminide 3-alpha-L-fucosyltransferase 9-like [Lytechinus variegatus]
MFRYFTRKIFKMGNNKKIHVVICLLVPLSLTTVFLLTSEEFKRTYRAMQLRPTAFNCSSCAATTRSLSVECVDKAAAEDVMEVRTKEEINNSSRNSAPDANTGAGGLITYNDNRVLYKFYRATWDPSYKCVIKMVRFHKIADGNVYHNHERNTFDSCQQGKGNPCAVEAKYTRNLTDFRDADVAILMEGAFKFIDLESALQARPPGQIWVLYSRECPMHEPQLVPPFAGNPYNLSMTYRSGSDIRLPYGQFVKDKLSEVKNGNKSRLMMWMASRCKPLGWERTEFVHALQKHLDVHIYGKCGTYDCPRDWRVCLKEMQKYKFYLSLENSECAEYITEKLWKNAYATGMVPVVFGARKEDYVRFAPPNSFIHLNDFKTMKEFVDYINLLDRNETLYNEYFEWKKVGRVTLGIGSESALHPQHLCELINKMVDNSVFPQKSWRWRTPDFPTWWNQSCTHQTELLGVKI